jgi:hypothetical protein
MAKTQAEWYQSLKSWVPEWFFEREIYSAALFQAMAKVLSKVSADVEDNLKQTFIDQAVGAYLDLLGDERSVPRLTGELDAQYAVRIKSASLISQMSKPSLLAIINQLLIAGVAQIKEDWEGGVFYNRQSFYNRAEIIIQPIENTFTIVVDKQVHAPYAFFNRENFHNREDFHSTGLSSDYVFQLILNAVNDNKAFGTLYRIFERLQ